MRRANRIIATLALLCAWASFAGAQDASHILAKMIEAQGGRKALAAVRTSIATGSMDMVQMGLSGGLTLYQKEPDKLRIDIEVMGLIISQAYDGEKGWMTDPQSGTTQEMPEAMTLNLKRQALGGGSLLDPEKAGVSYSAQGRARVGDRDCFLLEQAFADGTKVTLYIDAASYLLLKSKAMAQDPVSGSDVDTETLYADYRKVGDTLAAFQMTTFQNGAEFVRMSFSKIEPNAPLEDAFFRLVR